MRRFVQIGRSSSLCSVFLLFVSLSLCSFLCFGNHLLLHPVEEFIQRRIRSVYLVHLCQPHLLVLRPATTSVPTPANETEQHTGGQSDSPSLVHAPLPLCTRYQHRKGQSCCQGEPGETEVSRGRRDNREGWIWPNPATTINRPQIRSARNSYLSSSLFAFSDCWGAGRRRRKRAASSCTFTRGGFWGDEGVVV